MTCCHQSAESDFGILHPIRWNVRRERRPDQLFPSLLEKIAKALDTTVEYLRGTTENPRLASAEPLPEYALEVIDSMLKLDRVHRYELMVIARSFVAASDNVDEMRIEEFIKLAIDLAEESHGELATDQVMSFLEELQKRMKGSSGRGLLGGNGPEQPS